MGRDRQGFTLVELLVAMTLLALISVALFGGLRFGTRVWETGNDRSDRVSEVVIAQSLLRRKLLRSGQRGAFQYRVGQAVFMGEDTRLLFTAPKPAQFGLGGIYLFEVSAEKAQEHRDLVLKWQLYRAADEDSLDHPFDDEHGDQRRLVAGIENVRISYFGSLEKGKEPRWYDDWNWKEGQLFPSIVSIEIEFPKDDPRFWPALVVAPKVASDNNSE